MKYRDNLPPDEMAKLMAEISALDAAYAEADAATLAPANEDEAAEAEAAWEGSMEYFNRYIAGDR